MASGTKNRMFQMVLIPKKFIKGIHEDIKDSLLRDLAMSVINQDVYLHDMALSKLLMEVNMSGDKIKQKEDKKNGIIEQKDEKKKSLLIY